MSIRPPLRTAKNTFLKRQAIAWRFELTDAQEHHMKADKVAQVLACKDDSARRLILKGSKKCTQKEQNF